MFVSNWRQAWKWLSIQLAALGIALQASVLAFPDIKNWLGDKITHYVGLLILSGIAIGRLKNQAPKNGNDDKPD